MSASFMTAEEWDAFQGVGQLDIQGIVITEKEQPIGYVVTNDREEVKIVTEITVDVQYYGD